MNRRTREEMQVARKEKMRIRDEKYFERRRVRFKKLTERATVSFVDGCTLLAFSNGQILKCRGPLPDSIFKEGK